MERSQGNFPKGGEMQAVVCHAPEDYRLESVPIPVPAAGEMVLQVQSVGICASDLKCYMGAPMFWDRPGKPGFCQAPIIPGHEFSGRVVAIGEGTDVGSKFQLDDLVVSEQIVPCNVCRYCHRGQYWMCMKHDIFGFANLHLAPWLNM